MRVASRRYTVFGHPIAHSLSPYIHEAFARQFGIELSYDTTDATAADFPTTARDFFAAGGAGANVTLPHKRAAYELADTRSRMAERVGTANVLTPRADGRLEAHNTDGDGLIRDLTERHQIDLHGLDVLLIGAGGAAHGVAWSLLDAGVKRLTIVNRNADRAAELCRHLDDPRRVCGHRWEELDAIGRFDLVINATSAGVTGQSLSLPASLVDACTLCYDLAYGDAAGGFLTWARTAGASLACDGLGMLLETAADAFMIWHGKRPDTEATYRELHSRHRGSTSQGRHQ